jgi:hypothetical protein
MLEIFFTHDALNARFYIDMFLISLTLNIHT